MSKITFYEEDNSDIAVPPTGARTMYFSADSGAFVVKDDTGTVSPFEMQLSDLTPSAIGTASAGTGGTASRYDHVHAHGNQAGGNLHAAATTSVRGFMSAADKVRLDTLYDSATAANLFWASPNGAPGTPSFRAVVSADLTMALTTPPAIGGVTPAAGTFTTLTATGAVALSPANANVVLSPTGTGLVTIAPATAGSMNNVAIGGSTPLAGTFTNLTATGLFQFANGSAANPSLALINSPTTGLYRVGADAIGYAAAGTHAWVMDANGRMIYGSIAGVTGVFSQDSRVQVHSVNSQGASVSTYLWSATASVGSSYRAHKSANGTVGVHGAVGSGERLAIFVGSGSDGTNFIEAAAIRFFADAASSSGIVPGRMDFLTMNAAGTVTAALRIDSAQKVLCFAELEIDGALNHDGSTLGFRGATPVAMPSAYTQTYSTTTRTHANPTSSDLSGITSSTTGTVLAEPGALYTQAEHQQNYRRIQDQYNNLRADVLNLKQLVNSMIDDRQADGLAQ